MPQGSVARDAEAECRSLAWRYLSRCGRASLDASDPVGEAERQLLAAMRVQRCRARREAATSGGTALAGVAALAAWMGQDHPSVAADLAFRMVSALPLTCSILDAGNAAVLLAQACHLSRMVRAGQIGRALRQALLHPSWPAGAG
ncbi:hypothetical protein EAH89_05385 [Roseomonas nepalensis]|uniref:Uncharacterized protein n=1 Tax=Muricoccus nepalensis TaxID=1854500 RepID=A0A502GEG4_9PROT|nr:hypothetical protein [Roseomonas nepalensis]TPG59670.1 hypothetical protein EAH89_05385 [Roseomonas nepalensis]